MKRFYLSFADSAGVFLGGCVVEAEDPKSAIAEAWRHQCNPGGEALVVGISAEEWAAFTLPMNRLLDRADLWRACTRSQVNVLDQVPRPDH